MDEAQDFAYDAHRMFGVVLSLFKDYPEDERPSILILADENQRLNQETNSTIEQIETAYFLGNDDIYNLTLNYRNTRQIAELASRFYTGLAAGIPEFPRRQGDKPRLFETDDLDAAVKRIVRHAKMNEEEEIGVLVRHDNTRKKFFNKLSHQLKGTKFRIRSYSGRKTDPNNDHKKLIFDDKSVLTVLNYASAKGLEFDTVFLPELQQNQVDSGNDLEFKMNLYVMISRARERLILMISDPNQSASVRQYLPLEDGLLET